MPGRRSTQLLRMSQQPAAARRLPGPTRCTAGQDMKAMLFRSAPNEENEMFVRGPTFIART